MSERIPLDEMALHFDAAYDEVRQCGTYNVQQLYGFIDVCDGLFWALRREARAWEPEEVEE